ncbi:hypothetical protein O181_037803 [Austropuccinia psidii MF-1]|uniref:Uncharacterized protein n=1 Tax=Austropuccinia psidii MF-1 TaxID=1389203 RepID=A0A9Q3DC59_9BASI|nr:hypothetical protein [Austropuccinia psidii MF-1]
MSPVHLRDLGLQRHKTEDREGLSRTRRPGRGHLGHSGGWQEIQGNHNHSAIYIPIQQKPQNRGLGGYGSKLGASFQKICLKEIDFRDLIVITKGWNPTRQFRLLEVRASRIRENQATIQAIEEQLTQTGNTKIPSGSQGVDQTSSTVASNHSGTNRSVAKSHHSSQSQAVSRRRQGYKGKNKTNFNQRKREISSPINRNIPPTHIEHNVITSESNLNIDELWLKMSQYDEKTQKQFAELEESHERIEELTASMDKIVKTLQEGHAQLGKASEESNKILNLVFE